MRRLILSASPSIPIAETTALHRVPTLAQKFPVQGKLSPQEASRNVCVCVGGAFLILVTETITVVLTNLQCLGQEPGSEQRSDNPTMQSCSTQNANMSPIKKLCLTLPSCPLSQEPCGRYAFTLTQSFFQQTIIKHLQSGRPSAKRRGHRRKKKMQSLPSRSSHDGRKPIYFNTVW